jgi:hypothetical protein
MICTISFKAVGGNSGSKIMRHSEVWKTTPIGYPEEGRTMSRNCGPSRGPISKGTSYPMSIWFLTYEIFMLLYTGRVIF